MSVDSEFSVLSCKKKRVSSQLFRVEKTKAEVQVGREGPFVAVSVGLNVLLLAAFQVGEACQGLRICGESWP